MILVAERLLCQTGLITKWSMFDVTKTEQLYDDEDFWEVSQQKQNFLKPVI